MVKKQADGNGSYYTFCFWIGYIFFIAGTAGTVTFIDILGRQPEIPVNPAKLVFMLASGSFFVYLGLAALLQAGLGTFWNDRLQEESDQENRSTTPESY